MEGRRQGGGEEWGEGGLWDYPFSDLGRIKKLN